jgi:hypothetical protein
MVFIVIVVDENIHNHQMREAIAAWYPGRVIAVTDLRPRTVIKDEAIPSLLCEVNQPTFITNNAPDFWQRVTPHSLFCIVAFPLSNEQKYDIPSLLRALLQLPQFNTPENAIPNIREALETK